jgi:hypothetical protein
MIEFRGEKHLSQKKDPFSVTKKMISKNILKVI